LFGQHSGRAVSGAPRIFTNPVSHITFFAVTCERAAA